MLKANPLTAGALEPAKRPGIWSWITGHYTRQGLWSLFLMCVFPLHAWALILAFRDVSWVTERTNSWDAVGVVSYGLMFTLVETVLIFVIFVLLGYLVPTRWNAEQRVTLLSLLVLLLSLWAILEQLYYLVGVTTPGWLVRLGMVGGHPLRNLYAMAVGLLVVTISVPVWLLLRTRGMYAGMRALMDRLSILSVFYLLLDVIGIGIVIARNL